MRISALSRCAGFGVLLAATIAVVACTGGNKPEPFVPIASPAASSGSVTSSTSSTVALPALSLSGIGVTGTLPTTSVAASITETLSVSTPNGITPFAKGRDTAPTPGPYPPIIYVELATGTNVTLNGIPAFAFTLPSVVTGDQYYLAGYNGTQWFSPISGPATVSGTTVTFAAVTTSIPISTTQPVYIALFAVPAGTITPTPSPTPVATPVASPSALAFDAATPTTAPLTVSETGDTAAFTAAISACVENPTGQTPASNAFVAQLNQTTATPTSGVAQFTITSGAETGSCMVTITDANNAAITVPVTVNTTGVIVYGKHRN